MIAAERQQRILDALLLHTFLSLPQLAEMLDVSVMTVRRDVAQLSARGQIIAVRGGVKSVRSSGTTVEGFNRHPSLLRAALEQIGDSQSIFLDGSNLCRELALYIPWRDDMTVITNDYHIAGDIIANTPANLYLIGGELRRSDVTFHRRIAQDALKTLNFELLFLAPDSWNERGVWHNEEHRLLWYQALLASSGKTILLARKQSYSRSGLFHLYPLEKADVILTDHEEKSCFNTGIITPSKLHHLK